MLCYNGGRELPVLANQAGRSGYVDMYPRESPNQPHHCGGGLVFAPDGEALASTQRDIIQDEMIVVELEAARLSANAAYPTTRYEPVPQYCTAS